MGWSFDLLKHPEHYEQEREETVNQLKAKLERGAGQAELGELIDGNEVFDELREMIEERGRSRPASQ
jgi:hypothetical protein